MNGNSDEDSGGRGGSESVNSAKCLGEIGKGTTWDVDVEAMLEGRGDWGMFFSRQDFFPQ